MLWITKEFYFIDLFEIEIARFQNAHFCVPVLYFLGVGFVASSRGHSPNVIEPQNIFPFEGSVLTNAYLP